MAPQIPVGMVLIPKVIFTEPLQAALRKATRPPNRRTSATRLRKAPGLRDRGATRLLLTAAAERRGKKATRAVAMAEPVQLTLNAFSLCAPELARPAPSDVCALRTRLAVC